MKDLKILSFTVNKSNECWVVSFAYTCSTGAGNCAGYPCDSPDAVMTCVKQLLSNEWPS